MKRVLPGLLTAALLTLSPVLSAAAEDKPAAEAPKKTEKAEKGEAPKAEASVTSHAVTIGGSPVAYTATAGTLIVRNEKDEPWASMGFVSYVKKDLGDPGKRPVTFAYNGGPGSSSVWLHMGVLGPKRIVVSDSSPTPPPPYRLVDNTFSVLDRTDLVLIDPVGTGLSRAAGDAKEKDFWGVDPDIDSVSRFIRQWVTENGRWNSPKYLLGESYGTTRSAGVVDALQTRYGMSFNGVILVSVALDLEAIFSVPGNDRPFPLFLPTYAATAWYHKALPNRPEKLEPFLDEVRSYALGPYTAALMKGDALSPAERAAVIRRLHDYTGLSEDYLDKADLRVRQSQFTQELLRTHKGTVGRLDSRFTGPTLDALAEDAGYDPQSAAISHAYTAGFLQYYTGDLKAPTGRTYAITNYDIARAWDPKHKTPGAPQLFSWPTLPNTGLDLAHALKYNADLRVLVLNGLFDLATPFLATEYMVSHLGLPSDLRGHIEMKYYPAGHMMYIQESSLTQFKADVSEFLDRTSRR
ncbi:MAG: S10 family peptidase [Thermoanaerobaculia bacterium]